MRLRRIRLLNFGVHRDLDLHFNPGLCGIVGANGAGKSTVVNAIYYALSGSLDRFDGVAAESIHDAAAPQDPSYVLLEAEHDGLDFVVHRGLRPDSHWLVAGGGKKILGARKVAEALNEKLGVNKQLLDRYVVVAQGQLFAFLSDTPGERAAAFQHLCGTVKAEQTVKAVDKFFERHPELAVPVAPVDLDALRFRLNTHKVELVSAENVLAEAKDRCLTEANRLKAEGVLQRRRRHGELTFEVNAARARCDSLEAEARDAAKAVDRMKLYAVPTPVEVAERDQLIDTLAVLRRDHAANAKLLAAFAKDGVAACPTCGTPTANLKPHLEAVRKQQTDLAGRIDSNAGRLESIEKKLAGYERNRKEYDAVRSRCEVAEVRLSSAAERLREVETALAAAVVSDDLLAKATAVLQRHEAARLEAAAVGATVQALQRAIATDEADLAAAEAVAARQVKAAAFADRLRAVKAVFHRQALPQVVAQANLAATTAAVNRNLAAFGRPFWVQAAEDLSFTVHFPGQSPRPAARLSEGQKSVLGVCFRQAIAEKFAGDLNLLVLDEPTSALDLSHRRYLAEALRTYAGGLHGRAQMLLVTHADELRESFDQLIELKAK